MLIKVGKLRFKFLGGLWDTQVVYIDGCRSVDRINCSLVTLVNRQRQSDGYQ